MWLRARRSGAEDRTPWGILFRRVSNACTPTTKKQCNESGGACNGLLGPPEKFTTLRPFSSSQWPSAHAIFEWSLMKGKLQTLELSLAAARWEALDGYHNRKGGLAVVFELPLPPPRAVYSCTSQHSMYPRGAVPQRDCQAWAHASA